MVSNIDILSSFKASTQGSNSKAASFISGAADKPNAFRDTLKAVIRSKSQYENRKDGKAGIGTEESKALRKELVGESKEKLRNTGKPEANRGENVNPVEEGTEKQNDITIEQLLLQLEELAKMQQAGDNTGDKQAALLESIKKALNDLTSVQTDNMDGLGSEILQTKLAELSAVLDRLQEELKTSGSLTGKGAYENFDKLSAILKEVSEKAGTASNKTAENSVTEQLMGQEGKTANELTAEDKSCDELSMQNLDENNIETAAQAKQKQDIKTEAPITGARSASEEALNTTEENTDDVITALESKLEKENASDKSSKQDKDTGFSNGAYREINKAADVTQNKLVNEEMAAVKPEQAAADNRLETVQNQVISPKAQTVSKADVINQIVKKAEVIINDAQPEMRMQLEPENLGKLTLRIAVEKGFITAKFVAESQEVKQIIESSFNELKDMLQEKGLEVQNFSVSVGHDEREYNNDNAFQQWKKTIKLNGRSNIIKGSYEGYLADDESARIVNPYSVHNGEFDHRA